MRVGNVVYIRVNPRDSMGVVDVVNALEKYREGMAFSHAVSIALSALLETMRSTNTIPTRDGYEYTEMMQPYSFKDRTSAKLKMGEEIYKEGLPEREERVEFPQIGARKKRHPLLQPVRKKVEVTTQEMMDGLLLKKQYNPEMWTTEDAGKLEQYQKLLNQIQ